ncbi:hypothetical protein BD311DRAFT_769295 [Dichomitus squalens]|uniref:Uncharacterized protein n=1 Tax=Dichomitus squalens TaxID=114155 RepID=A0A4Q9M9A7_9APHY|nr:hypothetical protein BD311DRAFT_769295 [Dichomitus squalens]
MQKSPVNCCCMCPCRPHKGPSGGPNGNPSATDQPRATRPNRGHSSSSRTEN